MELNCKLVEKTFKDSDGKSHPYYTLSFKLIDDTVLEIPVKGDKAKLLILSNSVSPSKKDDFWAKIED